MHLCRVCAKNPTIDAHLMPKCFVREVNFDPKSSEKHILHKPDGSFKYATTTGRYEKELLCAICDGVLGNYEASALKLLKRLRSIKVGQKYGEDVHINEGLYKFRVVSPNDFLMFALGIVWKYASLSQHDAAYIDIGHYKSVLEGVLFKRHEIPKDIDVFIERDMFAFGAFPDPEDVYFYCTPRIGYRGIANAALMTWFSVGGFIIYVKIDEKPSDFAPKQCWMKDKKEICFYVSARSINENSSIAISSKAIKQDLDRLNKNAAVRSSTKKL